MKKNHEFGGFDKEPPQPHGPRLKGPQPIVHSHSKGRLRKVTAGKKQNRKNSL
jgi:hypothetical protein